MEGSEHERVHKVVMQGAYVLSRFFVEDLLPWLWWTDVINGLYAKLDKSFRDLDESEAWMSSMSKSLRITLFPGGGIKRMKITSMSCFKPRRIPTTPEKALRES
ncbi:hypothetical protein ACLOJK_009252 [Asimina triloba]